MTSTVAFLVFGLDGLLLVGLAIPLIRRSVPPNRLYGFRVPATLADERLWYEVNAKTGVDVLLVGVCQLALVGIAAAGFISEIALIIASLVATMLGLLATAAHGFALIARSEPR